MRNASDDEAEGSDVGAAQDGLGFLVAVKSDDCSGPFALLFFRWFFMWPLFYYYSVYSVLTF